MFGMQASNDYQPLTWMRRVPVYAITIFVALNVLGMFATAIAMAVGWDVALFAYNPERFLAGHFWEPFTYAFINAPTFFFPFSMLFLYSAGVEVEKYLGRSQFLKLLALMLLVPPVVLTVWSGVGLKGLQYGGSSHLAIGMIIAFATLYPNLELFGWVTLKWIAFAGLVLSAMQSLAGHDLPGFTIVIAMSGLAFGCVRLVQRGGFPELPKWPSRSPKSARPARRRIVERAAEPEEDVVASIDPLLEKIARSGLQSLSPKEREQLERARQSLLNKH